MIYDCPCKHLHLCEVLPEEIPAQKSSGSHVYRDHYSLCGNLSVSIQETILVSVLITQGEYLTFLLCLGHDSVTHYATATTETSRIPHPSWGYLRGIRTDIALSLGYFNRLDSRLHTWWFSGLVLVVRYTDDL